jgi:ABC-type Zn uptake system ZnuABC Zn-binding protein ZnuA
MSMRNQWLDGSRAAALKCALALGAVFASSFASDVAVAKVQVVASTNDLASIAASVGGEAVAVKAIARPGSDVHRVEVLPSYMVRVAKADLYLKVGLGLDQWADAVIDGARNARLTVVDCAQGIEVRDKPAGKVDASMGDVHPAGNPHYWLDPRNGGVIARTIADALSRADPARAGDYTARAAAFAAECDSMHARSRERLAGLTSRTLVTYHDSWVYFAGAFDLTIAGRVEPKPGIPPTARHLDDLVGIIRQRQVQVLVQEPYFSGDPADFLRRSTGIRVVKLSPSADGIEPGSYLAHIGAVVDAIRGSAETEKP